MHKLKCPNLDKLKQYKCPYIPTYGLIILPDPFEQIDEAIGLITDLKSNTEYTTSTSSLVGGVVVSISEDFHEDEVGYYKINIGDRILAPASKATLLVDSNINKQLAQIREPDILAVIPSDLKISVE